MECGATSVSFSDIVSSDAAEASATLSMLRVSVFNDKYVGNNNTNNNYLVLNN